MGSDNVPQLHTIKEVCDLIQGPRSVPTPLHNTQNSLLQILLSCKLRLAGLSKPSSLNQAGDFSPFQVNPTQGLIIFQRPAKSHLGPYFFPSIFSGCIFQFSVSNPTWPNCKCKTSPSAECPFFGGQSCHLGNHPPGTPLRENSTVWGELLYEISKSNWQLEPRRTPFQRYTQAVGRQRLQPVIPELPGKDAHGGSKKHRYCQNLATATVRKV